MNEKIFFIEKYEMPEICEILICLYRMVQIKLQHVVVHAVLHVTMVLGLGKILNLFI